MADGQTDLTKRLCTQFLDASEQLPSLEFIAVAPARWDEFDVELLASQLMHFPMPSTAIGWRHVLRNLCHGCELLDTEVIWLGDNRGMYIGGEVPQSALWNCAFVYRRPSFSLLPWNNWRAKARHKNGIRSFIRLSSVAASYFLPSPHMEVMGDQATFVHTDPHMRWLAELWRLGFFEAVSDSLALVLRLRGNLFATSALAIEQLRPLPITQAAPVESEFSPLVTLDQVAPLAALSKRSLERHLKAGRLPEPDVYGGGGKAHKWYWHHLRRELSKVAGRPLPEIFPGSRFV